MNILYRKIEIKGKVRASDVIYRETFPLIQNHKQENHIVVEKEYEFVL